MCCLSRQRRTSMLKWVFLFYFKAAGAILGTLPLCPHPILITLQRSHFHMSLTYKSGDYIPSARVSSEYMQTVSVIFQMLSPLAPCLCLPKFWQLSGNYTSHLPCVPVGRGVPSQKPASPVREDSWFQELASAVSQGGD